MCGRRVGLARIGHAPRNRLALIAMRTAHCTLPTRQGESCDRFMRRVAVRVGRVQSAPHRTTPQAHRLADPADIAFALPGAVLL